MAEAIKLQANSYTKLYKRELGTNELTEIRHNLVGFFDALIQLDRLKKQEEKRNDQQNQRSSSHAH